MKTNFFKSIAKTQLIASLLLTILTLAACQDEKQFIGSETTPGEVVTLSLSPVLPANAGIRPLSSADGGATELSDASYDLRYILEVYDGATLVGTREVKTVDEYQSSASVTFEATLPAKQYQFVFWADFVTESTDTDLTYKTDNADGLRAIEWLTSDYTIGDNLRDAYYATQTIDLTAPVGQAVTLHRPFGKLRILATDVKEYLDNNPGTNLGVAKLTYSAPTAFSKGFNALTGVPASANISLAAATCTPEYVASVSVGGKDFTNVYVLAFDYFFVPSDLSTVSFDIELLDDQDSPLASKTVTNAPVGVNKLTTVLGSIFAKYTADFSVTIADNFGDEELTIDEALIWPELKAEKLVKALGANASATGATVTLTGNATAAEVAVPAGIILVVPSGTTLTVTGTLTNAGTISIAGAVDATAYGASTGTVTHANGGVSNGIISKPANAYSGQVWGFGNLVWSDRINMADCNKAFARSESAAGGTYSDAGVTRYYYNWHYVDTNKESMCPSPWRVPTSDDFGVILTATTGADLTAAWGFGGRYDSWGSISWYTGFNPQGLLLWSATSDQSDGTKAMNLQVVPGWGTWAVGGDSKMEGRQVRCVRN